MRTKVAVAAMGALVVAAIVGMAVLNPSSRPEVAIALDVRGLGTKDRGTIMREGAAIARIEPGWPGRVQLAGPVDPDSMVLQLPTLTMALARPCGERVFPLTYDDPSEATLRDALQFKQPIELKASVDWTGSRSIVAYIDNRNRSDATMSVGQYRFSVTAGIVERVALPVEDTCAEGRQLRMADEIVAELPAEQSSGRDSSDGPVVAASAKAFLIDPTGKRCYEQRFHSYGGREQLRGIPPPGVYGLRSDIRFSGGHLHPLPEEPNFLFEDVPEKVTISSFAAGFDRGERTSLHDLGCTTE
ncbi:MAG: hypothetical protein SFV19_08465 [Rhodospirillaceae bacterium]|nr:hypothetical protein [Rhodospirillaceae bacterium]